MALFFLAIIAGVLTVLSPCILPVLPIVLSAGASGDKRRPFFVVLGFVGAFSIVGGVLASVGNFLGLSGDTLRILAVIFLTIFGLALVFPVIYLRLTAGVASLLEQVGGSWATKASTNKNPLSGLLVGLALGLVWTPCAGPILGTILSFAATGGSKSVTTVLLAAYALGAGAPMLAIAYGGGGVIKALRKVGADAEILNKIFGGLIIVAAILIAFGVDRTLAVWFAQFYPTLNLL